MLKRLTRKKETQHLRLSKDLEDAEHQESQSEPEVNKKDMGQDIEKSSRDLYEEDNQQQQAQPWESEQQRKRPGMLRSLFKGLIIAGLAVVVIVILFLPAYQRMEKFEAQLQKLKETKITERADAKAEANNETLDDRTKEERDTEKQMTVLSAKDKLLKEASPAEKFRQRNWASDPNSNTFDIPSLVWTYADDPQRETFFVRKCLENIARFSKASGFQLNIINESNYMDFVEETTFSLIAILVQALRTWMAKEPTSNLKEHFETIKKRLIVFHVLNENGGIFIEKNVLFAETFEWLKHIESNIHVNKGRGTKVKARYFGFFDLNHGPQIYKFNKTGVAYEQEKYFVRLPTFEPYFLAAQPRQQFLTEVLLEYAEIITDPKKFREKFNMYHLYLRNLQGKDVYFQFFYTCQLIVLARKQQALNKADKYGNTFAIDQLGFLTMNERYFPKKLGFYFEREMHDKFYWSLARYSIPQLERITGPIRYIVYIAQQENLESQLLKTFLGLEKIFIHPESLIGKLVIQNDSEPYVLKEYVREVPRENKTWDKLPRKIWQYWDTGIKNSSVANKLCYDNLRRAAAKLGFQVIQVNNANSEQYIGKELNDKINNWIKNAKITTFSPTRSDFIRLALIYKQGGIYLDLSQFSIDTKGIEWILNIANEPLESISNRYGELPKALVSHQPHFGVNFNETYDKRANTNRQMNNDYLNHFIIAEPNQQVILDWFEEYGRFLTTPYHESENLMREIGMFGDHWTKLTIYLAAMESLKIVIGKKNKFFQKMIDQDPNYNGPVSGAEYYGLWSFNSYQVERFKYHSNFDNTYNNKRSDYNLYLWRYSHTYVEGIIGKVQTLTKIVSPTMGSLNNYLTNDFGTNFSNLHPESLVAKYLYLPELHKLTKINGKLSLDLSP